VEFTEDLGLFASFLVWAIFGALLLVPHLQQGVTGSTILYAALSLTLVRMVPVAVSMIGTGLRPVTSGFMGWFGPRGLASVVFTLIAFETLEHSDVASALVVEVATWTVFFSVIAHGVTAGPLANLYGRRVADAPAEHASTHIGNPLPRSLGRPPSDR
jgi:NhaP-type Na+/H+ or K+/H+ antiporter